MVEKSGADLSAWLRFAQLQSWLQEGRPPYYTIGLFFNPVGFLTAVKQEMTRMHDGWALDLVKVNSWNLQMTTHWPISLPIIALSNH